MARAYKREITTPEQKAIYDTLKAKRAERKQAEKELDDHGNRDEILKFLQENELNSIYVENVTLW